MFFELTERINGKITNKGSVEAQDIGEAIKKTEDSVPYNLGWVEIAGDYAIAEFTSDFRPGEITVEKNR